jgi:hypothetical protein
MAEEKAPRVIWATSMRPTEVQTDGGPAVALEIVAETGDQFVIVLSGEGLAGLIQDIQLLLEESPHIAGWRGRARQ